MGSSNIIGNVKLVRYGIGEEESDYRVHVCFVEGYVYVFPTEDANLLIKTFGFVNRPAYQTSQNGKKIKTAKGYPVPVESIKSCGHLQRVKIPNDISEKYPIWKDDREDIKGKQAEKIVEAMCKKGLISVKPEMERTSSDEQKKGQDFKSKPSIWQVKCDYKGGSTGTGNLYIQTEECNPFGLH